MRSNDPFHELNPTREHAQRLIDEAAQIRLEAQELRARLVEKMDQLTDARSPRQPD